MQGEGAALFQVLEALFLFSGGLTMAYLLKLFICLFLERNALPEEVLARKWRQEGEHYVAPASVGVLLAYLLVMLRFGTDPGAAMDPIAAFARDFLGGDGPRPSGGLLCRSQSGGGGGLRGHRRGGLPPGGSHPADPAGQICGSHPALAGSGTGTVPSGPAVSGPDSHCFGDIG